MQFVDGNKRTGASAVYHPMNTSYYCNRILEEWQIPPGSLRDGSFDSGALASWVQEVKTRSIESGHWEVAAGKIGAVLFFAPRAENGLWIDSVCTVLDEKDHVRIRRGLTTRIFNSRDVFTPDGGKTELKLAAEWENKGSLAENGGFSYLVQELKRFGNLYRTDAARQAKNNSFEID
jgi:hypothetical protein